MLSLITAALLALMPAGKLDVPTPDPVLAVENDSTQPPQRGDAVDRFGDYRRRGGGQPIPEPGTILLFGSGIVAAGWITRRRKKTHEPRRD